MFKLNYYYDGALIGDLFPLSQKGFKYSVIRNEVGKISFDVSLKQLKHWCDETNFDINRIFTPIKSSIKVVDYESSLVSGTPTGGWLASTPSFTFGSNADTIVNFNFVGWLGLCAGYYIIPPLTYNAAYNTVIEQQILLARERTFLAGAQWPITSGDNDTLLIRQGTLEAPKTLKDFMLEHADDTNFIGGGSYDVYVDADAVITLKNHYGQDLSSTVTLSYPDFGSKYDVKEISFPAWDNYISDIFLTGAGNGYETTSGANGAALFSEVRNEATILSTGYFQHAVAESDISVQANLDDKATSYVKDTDKPFSIPSLVLDASRIKLYSHDQGGELWLGDTVTIDVTNWANDLMPIDTPTTLRIRSLDVAVDGSGQSSVSLGMSPDVQS